MTDNYIVYIELQRVQTFLFAVPRLADIVGANALLGEVMRYELSSLATKTCGAIDPSKAKKCGATAPTNIQNLYLVPQSPDDPLSKITQKEDKNIADSPEQQWKNGILARDGGHFHAYFKNKADAEKFERKAAFLLREKLSGLRFSIKIKTVAELENSNDPQKANSVALFDLPFLQQCEEAGNGVAVDIQKYTGGDERAVGLSAKQCKDSWFKFKNGKDQTDDIASVMGRQLNLTKTSTFDDLCDGDYLALIHADGNGLGKMQKAIVGEASGLEKEAKIENFFHTMRVTLRCALKQAITKLYQQPEYKNYIAKDGKLEGIQILMLGGDDLLIACRAPLALPLVHYLAEALNALQKDTDTKQCLTLGVGVAIAKPSFPFHRLHDLAEELASSAKRLVRDMDKPVSVVDWGICSEAWHGDLSDVRRNSLLCQYQANGITETLALSAKPYRVLKNSEQDKTNLASLLDQMKTLDSKNYARSQLRELVRLMRKGRRQADFAYQDLEIASPETWKELKKIFGSTLWHKFENNDNAYSYISQFADLVELTEIKHLKTEKNRADKNKMLDNGESK